MSHWCENYVGKPWRVGARGPEAFDCFGLVWHVYKHHFGIELPTFAEVNNPDVRAVMAAISKEEQGPDWQRIKIPVDGCAVGLSTTRLFHHVGVYLAIDGGHLLHALDKSNVILTPILRLQREGWQRVEFFKHKRHGAHC